VSRVRALLRRVHALVRPRDIDRDLDEEIAAHLAEAEEEYVRRGLPLPGARLAALRDFGGVTHARERHRDVRSFVWLENAWRDLRYGSSWPPCFRARRMAQISIAEASRASVAGREVVALRAGLQVRRRARHKTGPLGAVALVCPLWITPVRLR